MRRHEPLQAAYDLAVHDAQRCPVRVAWVAYPPSANRLWRAVNGRQIKSAKYRAWTAEVVDALCRQRVASIVGPYRMTLTATRPDRRRRDLSNLLKPVEDALVAAGIVEDDCKAKRIVLEWSDDEPDPTAQVIITVEPV